MQMSTLLPMAGTAFETRAGLERLASQPGTGERRMTGIAATGLFHEALLFALRAHLTELKAAAK